MWSLIAFVGLIVTAVGVVGVIRPIPKLLIGTRGRAAGAVIAGFVMLAVGAVQDQAANGQRLASTGEAPAASVAAPPPRAPEWTEVISWRGSGIKETESFAVASREWRIRWKSGNEPIAGAGFLQIFVYGNDGSMVSLAANNQGPGEDVSYVRAPPGRYYLTINGANIDWDISVEDQR